MKVCLINPPQPQLWNPRSYPPLGLLYIAARLEQEGIEVCVHHQPERSLEEQLDDIPGADVYGITATSAMLPEARRLVDALRPRKAITAIGGIHATLDPQEALDYTGADVAFDGEGEYSFPEWCKGQHRNRRIVRAGRIYNLDDLPWPARHLLPWDVIRDTSGIHAAEDAVKRRQVSSAKEYTGQDTPATTIITSRGCPYRCAFCSKSRITEGVRYRSPQNILQELCFVRVTHGVHHFRIVDDAVTIDRVRAEELFEMTTGEDLTFTTILRADSIRDKNMLQRMYKGGVRFCSFGAESGDQGILDRVNKRESVREITRAIRWCREVGIKTKVFLIFGLPGETLETVEATKRFMRDARPDSYTLSSFQPLPGSAIYEDPRSYGLVPLDSWYERDQNWFYWEPDDDRGFPYQMPAEVRKARGDLIRYLRSGDWRADR